MTNHNRKDQIVPDFHNADFSELMPLITVYDHPKDYPEHFIARIWHIGDGKVFPTDMVMIAETIEEIRAGIPARFTRLNRDAHDDETIMETWI